MIHNKIKITVVNSIVYVGLEAVIQNSKVLSVFWVLYRTLGTLGSILAITFI